MTKPTLDQLQRSFADVVTEGADLATLVDRIVPGGTLDAAAAIDVYRGAYSARLCDQLGETYEAVWWVLGDERFFALGRAFVAAHRSTSHNLSDYGEHFAAFLETTDEAREFSFLPALARLEWRLTRLFHEADEAPVDASGLASVADPADARLRFGPHFFFDAPYALHEIWQRRGAEGGAVESSRWRRPVSLLVCKKHGRVWMHALEPPVRTVFAGLADGATLGEALAAAVPDGDADDAAVASWFTLLFDSGVVVEVH